ncbi:multiprotein-bridging factor 1 family protein [Fibrobacterota bacterium]
MTIDISKAVREIREKNGWTQEKMAQELGVSFSTVNGWENGRRQPQPFLMRRLEEMLNEK